MDMLRNEDLLIRLCAQANLDQESKDQIKEHLHSDLNWSYFLQKSRNEYVCGILYKTFLAYPDLGADIPPWFFGELKKAYNSILGRNILVLKKLEQIIGLFNRQGIDSLIFKGIALGQLVYGDIGKRATGDVDILVKKRDLEKADSILKRSGYSTPFDIKDFVGLPFNRYRNSFLYSNLKATPKYIHLYYHFINFLPYHVKVIKGVDMDRIWKDSKQIELGDVKTRTFSVYHQMIFLCMHALHHSPKALIRLCDINELIDLNKGNIDWQKFAKEAFDFGLDKHLYYILYAISKIFKANIPQDTLKTLRPKRVSFFERKFMASLLEGKPMFQGELLVYLGMNETLADRVLFLFRTLFPSPNELALIRQQARSKVDLGEYLRRIRLAFTYFLKSFLKIFRLALH